MPLIRNVATVRIDLPAEGEWVDVKERLSVGERKKIQAAAFSVNAKMNGNGAEPEMALNYEAAAFAGLEAGIVAWSFPEPVTPENIRCLDEESFDLIAKRIDELWEPRSEDAEKNSSSPGATPSEEKDESQANSAG